MKDSFTFVEVKNMLCDGCRAGLPAMVKESTGRSVLDITIKEYFHLVNEQHVPCYANRWKKVHHRLTEED